MFKTPISLIIDDSAPMVHVYRVHAESTKDGRPLADIVPNAFLDKFCALVAQYAIKGKFSIVPAPAGAGDIVNGIPGYAMSDIKYWLDTVKRRLADFFDFCPEMLTHNKALDLRTGEYFAEDEKSWSFKQDRTALAPYISHALKILKDAGIDATGVTSPWNFGEEVEQEYIAAIVEAQKQIYGRRISWYFLHCIFGKPGVKPWVAYKEGNVGEACAEGADGEGADGEGADVEGADGAALVSIPATVNDYFWQTIDTTRADDEYIRSIADNYITEDGADGDILNVLNSGGWPILVTHWQSLFSNGLETGLKALELVACRVDRHMMDRVEWKTSMEMTEIILEEEKSK